MPKFIAKPPVIEAEYWDGTIDGFEAIRDLLRRDEDLRYVSFQIMTRGNVEGGTTGTYVDLDGLPMVGGKDANRRMYADCWLMKHDQTGKYEIIATARLNQYYELSDD
jgi:hypothetical protein